MQNTSSGRADDLPTVLRTFKNDPKLRSVNHFLERLDFGPNCIKDVFCQPKCCPAQNVAPGPRAPVREEDSSSLDARLQAFW